MNQIKNRPVNNFDLLRLVAATGVLYAHGFILYGHPTTYIPTDQGLAVELFYRVWRYFQINLGNLGVQVFFLISGYLISKSIISNPGQWGYWQKRLLRIMPGLIVCVLASVFLMGPLFTSLSLGQYFSTAGTYLYLKSISMYQLGSELPGVFSSHPAQEINGSLWTLRYEFTCYIMVALFSLMGIIKNRWAMVAVFIVMCLAYITIKVLGIGSKEVWNKLEYALIYTDLKTSKLVHYAAFFQVGILFNLFEKQVKLKGWMAAMGLVTIIAINMLDVKSLYWLQFPAMGAIVFYLSYIKLPERVRYPLGHHDYSYGIYIYGMPVQQMLIGIVGLTLNVYLYIALCVLAVLPFAIFSWHVVEKPMLALKPRG